MRGGGRGGKDNRARISVEKRRRCREWEKQEKRTSSPSLNTSTTKVTEAAEMINTLLYSHHIYNKHSPPVYRHRFHAFFIHTHELKTLHGGVGTAECS